MAEVEPDTPGWPESRQQIPAAAPNLEDGSAFWNLELDETFDLGVKVAGVTRPAVVVLAEATVDQPSSRPVLTQPRGDVGAGVSGGAAPRVRRGVKYRGRRWGESHWARGYQARRCTIPGPQEHA
jgi:hypothetical protein